MAKELLKDVAVRNAKPTDKDFRLSDGEGLYLLVKANGAKWWRFDYTFSGSRKTLSLGVYPVTSLSDARRKQKTQESRSAMMLTPVTSAKRKRRLRLSRLKTKYAVMLAWSS